MLAQGGFGITYLANDTNLDQQVAIIEFLRTDLATLSAISTVHPLTDAHEAPAVGGYHGSSLKRERSPRAPARTFMRWAIQLYRDVTIKAPPDATFSVNAVLESRDALVPAAEAGAGRFTPSFLAALDSALGFRPETRPQSVAQWRKDFEGAEPVLTEESFEDDFSEAPTQIVGKAAPAAASSYNQAPNVAVSSDGKARKKPLGALIAASMAGLAVAGGAAWGCLNRAVHLRLVPRVLAIQRPSQHLSRCRK